MVFTNRILILLCLLSGFLMPDIQGQTSSWSECSFNISNKLACTVINETCNSSQIYSRTILNEKILNEALASDRTGNYSNLVTEYTYNLNGSITKDLNRGISDVQYNDLNLPNRIDIKSPVGKSRSDYTYSSSGEKLRIVHKWNPAYSSTPVIGSGVAPSSLTSSETIDYVGNCVYINNSLKYIETEFGYIEGGGYHYYSTDHLGSNRFVTTSTGPNEGINSQVTNYYPYGMSFGDQQNPDYQSYKFTGKELDMKQGLNWYDFHARFYDPATCRFMTMDPKAEIGLSAIRLTLNVAMAAKFMDDIVMPIRVAPPVKANTPVEVNANFIKSGNTFNKNGLTVAGRALQKHGSRIGSVFPKATGNTATINAQGESVLNGILTNPNVTSVTRYHARFGNILEYRIPGGQGARFSSDGKTFIGFLEP